MVLLNVKKDIYWSKCNNTLISIRIIKKNLLRFLIFHWKFFNLAENWQNLTEFVNLYEMKSSVQNRLEMEFYALFTFFKT